MKKPRPKKPIIRPINDKCPFCESKLVPDYKKADELSRYITDRGKIMQLARSGLCTKHQRNLSMAIKRARHLALLPYVGGI
jgi:small subunit ribosomal protein S18